MSHVMERSKTEQNEVDRLSRKWQKIKGEPMPEVIEQLPIGKIRLAVQVIEGGGEVVVPKSEAQSQRAQRASEFGSESFLSQWDGHNNG